jgi:hypothetical protein
MTQEITRKTITHTVIFIKMSTEKKVDDIYIAIKSALQSQSIETTTQSHFMHLLLKTPSIHL